MSEVDTNEIHALILGYALLSSVIIDGAGIWSAKRVDDKDSAKMMNLIYKEKVGELDGMLATNTKLEQVSKSILQVTGKLKGGTDDITLFS